MTILEMSGMGAVLIAFTLLLRRAIGHRLPPGCYLALWAMAGLRLLVPAAVSSPFSVYRLFSEAADTVSPVDIAAVPMAVNDAGVWIDTNLMPMTGQVSINWVLILWGMGAVCCFACMVSSHWQCRRWYAASFPVETAFVRQWQAEHPLHRTYQIRQCQMVQSPLTYGLLRPVILLPAKRNMTDDELHLILLHEWNHICHLDVLWQWMLVLLCSVHWFNPAVWVMYFFCRQDLELFCDSATTQQLAEPQSRQYALLLIQQAAGMQRPVPLFSPSRFTGYQRMEERIQTIMKPKKFSWRTAVVTILLLGIGGAVFAASAADDVNSADVGMDTGSVKALVWPVASEDAEVTTVYGVRENPVTGEVLKRDYICIGGQEAEGVAIMAAADGIVKEAGFDARQGHYLLVAHGDNLETRYWHCRELLVEPGDAVSAYQQIATLGKTGAATGPCLSFAVYQDGEACDPMAWFAQEEKQAGKETDQTEEPEPKLIKTEELEQMELKSAETEQTEEPEIKLVETESK